MYLVDAGADVNVKMGASGHTALSWAVTCDAIEFAQAMQRRGAKPDLFCAAGMGAIEDVAGWFDADVPHGSVVLLQDGHLVGRTVSPDGVFSPMERIMVVGDDVQIDFDNGGAPLPLEAFADRHARAFGAATTRLLRRLTVAVLGVSGTGSPLIEMLLRLGVGRLLLI